MALKQSEAQIYISENKLSPDELDQDQHYTIINTSIGSADIGTVSVVGDAGSSVVLTQQFLDFPRAVKLAILGVAGGQGGTAIVTGKNQFGGAVTETLGFATAAGGGTAEGTKVFAKVTTATVTAVGLGGTAIGSTYLGVAVGSPMLVGLPARLGAAADLKRVTWHDAGVSKALNINSTGTSATGGTLQSAVSLQVAGGFATADSYTFTYRSSFEAEAAVFST